MHLDLYHAANIHDVDEDGFTALHHAARYNRVKVLERLLMAGGGKGNVWSLERALSRCMPRPILFF